MKRTKYQYKPRPDQLDSTRIDTDTVQFWRNGVMVTAQMTKESAQRMIADGKAFVITGQAIGALDENGFSIS